MQSYDEHAFRGRVDAALRRIRTILDHTRNPQYAADVPHRYDDKYLLAELVTRTATASVLQCLEVMGITAAQLGELQAWARSRSVTLRLTAQEDCRFLREEKRKIESGEERVTETRGILGTKTRTEKVVTTVTEYFWQFEVKYALVAFQGTALDNAITVYTRTAGVEIKTTQNTTPRPKVVVRPQLDVNLTWLLAHVDAESRASFSIDRKVPECHTPRRNPAIDAALEAFDELAAWCVQVVSYFQNELFPIQQQHGRDLSAIHAGQIFNPVLPLFETNVLDAAEGVVPVAYTNAFLAEEQRSLTEQCRTLATVFPRDSSLITSFEACLLVIALHMRHVCLQLGDCLAYIEDMLRKQLVAAIGKEVTPADFTAYMEFHQRKLFAPEYRPRPFSCAIRRPEHYPEGVLAIEAGRDGNAMAISTTVRSTQARRAMTFSLDASTRVEFFGERHLHAWISHQFSGQSMPALNLVARARQFSSFILLVGRIVSADSFEPRIGVIVQNKDSLLIPLLLEQIPTPKEFRDAIESLSPEQQRFASAFRGMQLESTLFGVCVIQIKPQLEKLLKLPADSLTKEIRLTQELLDLFIQYQIPSDLLSYDGLAESPTDDKLERVKHYVARMYEMIQLSKARSLVEEEERSAMRLAENDYADSEYTPPYGNMAQDMAMEHTRMLGMAAPTAHASARSAPPPARPMMSAPPPAMAPPAPMAPRAAQMPSPPMPAAPVAATPTPPTQPQPAQRQETPRSPPDGDGGDGGGQSDITDYTRIPAALDRKFEALDVDGALRATIIKPGDPWTRTAQRTLLDAEETRTLSGAEQKSEKNKAFDLLDALSRSGALPIDDASLHVVVAATHCFDKTLLETVIQDNVNPIEKVERSLMIVGTTIHDQPAAALLADDQRARFFETSPQLGPPAAPDDGG